MANMSKRTVEDFYPLTAVQAGLLFHTLYDPSSGMYAQQLSCVLEADRFDAEIFQEAWRRVMDRHAILRTSFAWEGLKEPVQAVHREVALPCAVLDWRRLSAREQREQLDSFLVEDRKRGFHFQKPPLMRLTLVRLDEQAWGFVWNFHHLLLDGWSLPIVLKEVVLFYETLKRGSAVPLDLPAALSRLHCLAETPGSRRCRGLLAKNPEGVHPAYPASDGACGSDTGREDDYGSQPLRFSESATEALRELARRRRLSLSTFVQEPGPFSSAGTAERRTSCSAARPRACRPLCVEWNPWLGFSSALYPYE